MELDKLILKFMWKNRGLKIAKTILGKSGRKIPDNKTNLESNHNKNIWHWCWFGQRNQ